MVNCYILSAPGTIDSFCNYISIYSLTTLVGCSSNAVEAKGEILFSRPDIVFVEELFIEKDDDLLKLISQISSIVLISQSTSKAFQAFESDALDYLINPVPFSRFVKCITKFDHFVSLTANLNMDGRGRVMNSFFIKADSNGSKEVLIKCDQVIYIQALQNYVVIHMENDKRFYCHNSMKEMDDCLSLSAFSRIHKSYIINEEKITAIEGNMVILNNDFARLLIGTTYRKSFFERKSNKTIKKKNTAKILAYPSLNRAV